MMWRDISLPVTVTSHFLLVSLTHKIWHNLDGNLGFSSQDAKSQLQKPDTNFDLVNAKHGV